MPAGLAVTVTDMAPRPVVHAVASTVTGLTVTVLASFAAQMAGQPFSLSAAMLVAGGVLTLGGTLAQLLRAQRP